MLCFPARGSGAAGYKGHFPPTGADVNSPCFCPDKGLLTPGCEAKHLSLYSWPQFNVRTRGQPGEQNKVVGAGLAGEWGISKSLFSTEQRTPERHNGRVQFPI